MSKYTDLAMERRSHFTPDGRPAWNCCQSVVSVFAEDAGYDEDACMRAATYFRGGMQMVQPLDDPETILLIDSWVDQAAIDAHHASPMMAQLAALREKYDLHMTVERFVSEDIGTDERFIRK